MSGESEDPWGSHEVWWMSHAEVAFIRKGVSPRLPQARVMVNHTYYYIQHTGRWYCGAGASQGTLSEGQGLSSCRGLANCRLSYGEKDLGVSLRQGIVSVYLSCCSVVSRGQSAKLVP